MFNSGRYSVGCLGTGMQRNIHDTGVAKCSGKEQEAPHWTFGCRHRSKVVASRLTILPNQNVQFGSSLWEQQCNAITIQDQVFNKPMHVIFLPQFHFRLQSTERAFVFKPADRTAALFLIWSGTLYSFASLYGMRPVLLDEPSK